MIGAHASLLPRDRGRAPINWALIRGERHTGNTLFWLTAGVDNGHVIDQVDDSDHAVRHLRVALPPGRGREPRHDPARRAGAVGGTASWPAAGAAFRSAAAEAAAGRRMRRLDAIERRGLRLRARADAALSRRIHRRRRDRLTIWHCARLPAAAGVTARVRAKCSAPSSLPPSRRADNSSPAAAARSCCWRSSGPMAR